MPEKKIVRFKVFLCDFADVRAPSGYDAAFVRRLFFDATRPERTPPPDRVAFGATLFQFFFSSSDGWLRVEGDVTDWVHSSLSIAKIPHWNATMKDPTKTTASVNYGESWPPMVAETFRGLGFTSDRYPLAELLRDAVLALPGGLRADRLVFLHTDRTSGGVRRGFGHMKSQLHKMSASNNNVRNIPGTTQLWNTLWDEAWLGLPDLLATPIIQPINLGTIQPDGTIPGPALAEAELHMAPLEVLFHEMGHLVADFPDLYGEDYGPWGVFDLMDGVWTHFPMPFSSYTRWKAGWLAFTERTREDHRLRLHPLESHNDAVRLPNGAPGSNHFLVLENRDELHYDAVDQPPTTNGRMLLAYRLDEHKRQRFALGDDSLRRVTGVVRRQASYGEAWKPGMTIGELPPANEIHTMPATCRNPLGELWWTVDEIAGAGPSDLMVRLRQRALHLLGDFHRATWEGLAPGQPAAPLTLDFFGGATGHVILQDATPPIGGQSRGRALYLHPRWAPSASIRGTYDLASLGPGPFRLYAKLAMPDEATGSDGTTLQFSSGAQSFSVGLAPGDYKEICVDFLQPGSSFQVLGEAGASATRDWIYILDGWLVPLPTVAYDFLANTGAAAWRSGAGPLTVGVQDQPAGEVSLRGRMTLHTGVEHGPRVLFTHPNWADNGHVEGLWSNVAVPAGGAFVRAAIGWHQGRSVTDNGATVTVAVDAGAGETVLINRADVNLYPAGASNPAERNDLSLLELPLPRATWGKNATFRVRVDTAGSAAQDWVSWTFLALTTA